MVGSNLPSDYDHFAPLPLFTAEAGKSIAINLSANPLSFDPLYAMNDAEKILLANLHEGLVLWDQGYWRPEWRSDGIFPPMRKPILFI